VVQDHWYNPDLEEETINYYGAGKSIGRDTQPPYVTKTYRTLFVKSFGDLGIPDNADLTKVKVYYTIDMLGSYTFTLRASDLPDPDLDPESYDEEVWSAAGSGQIIEQGIAYGNGSLVSPELKNSIRGDFPHVACVIGATSDNEGEPGSAASLDIEPEVTYEYEGDQIISLEAKNDLDGGDGGELGVGYNEDGSIEETSSPHPFPGYVTQHVRLKAYDNQDVNNKTWFFNDTEYPQGQRSDWKKYNNGQNTSISNSASFTTDPLTPGDDGAVYTAYLRTTDYTTSGTMSSNETWFTSNTLTGDVTVPAGVTLTLSSTGTVHLNGHSILSTGGTIDKESNATITGLHATLQHYTNIKGLFGAIQPAVNHAEGYDDIRLPAGNFAGENVTIDAMLPFSFYGAGWNATSIGKLTITSSTATSVRDLTAESVYLSGSDYGQFRVDIVGSGSDGFQVWNSSAVQYIDHTIQDKTNGMLFAESDGDVNDAVLYDNQEGVWAQYESNVEIENSDICSSDNHDLAALLFSSLYASNCDFTGGTPSILESMGGDVSVSGAGVCSFGKTLAKAGTIPSEATPVAADPVQKAFQQLNRDYFALTDSIHQLRGQQHAKARQALVGIRVTSLAHRYARFIRQHPDHPLARTALVTAAHALRQGDDPAAWHALRLLGVTPENDKGEKPGASDSLVFQSQNTPNPFNPATMIHYTLPAQSRVRITVYDLLGREVCTLVDAVREAGEHQVQFDASELPSGMYFYTLTAGGYTRTQKMLLVK